jgi:hypothetical protein
MELIGIPMEFLWIPKDSYGFLRIPMDSLGILRNPMDSGSDDLPMVVELATWTQMRNCPTYNG